jgi:hypothetical protein
MDIVRTMSQLVEKITPCVPRWWAGREGAFLYVF